MTTVPLLPALGLFAAAVVVMQRIHEKKQSNGRLH
jgi:hypothetical protein